MKYLLGIIFAISAPFLLLFFVGGFGRCLEKLADSCECSKNIGAKRKLKFPTGDIGLCLERIYDYAWEICSIKNIKKINFGDLFLEINFRTGVFVIGYQKEEICYFDTTKQCKILSPLRENLKKIMMLDDIISSQEKPETEQKMIQEYQGILKELKGGRP